MEEGNAVRERPASGGSAIGAVVKVPPTLIERYGHVGLDSGVPDSGRRETESPPDYESRSGDRGLGGSRANRDARIDGGGT